jgi:hypothetical protein
MGTRSTVKFYSEHSTNDAKPMVCIYQQYDGYIEGVGFDLANFLKGKKVINGFNDARGESIENGFANGMGCLAAQYIASIKTKIGGVYIADLDDSEDYDYEVRLMDDRSIQIKVDEFIGSPEGLLEYKERQS